MFETYHSVPRTVKAVQFTAANKDRIFDELSGRYAADIEDGQPIIKVTTIHGEVAIVRLGDWIVKEHKNGYYYPVKDEIFWEYYA